MAGSGDRIAVRGSIVVVLEDVETGEKEIHATKNIVTDAGDLHYAQEITAETLTNAFGILELGTAGNAPAKGSTRADVTAKVASSQKAFDSGYPVRVDPDSDNTGDGVDVVSYRVSYSTSEANDTDIDRVIITNVTPGASEPVQSYGVFGAPFTKGGTQTAKIFVNHTLNGT